MSFDWESYQASQAQKRAFYLHKGKNRCLKCDMYQCICQLSLSPDWVEVRLPIKEPSFSVKVQNCPHNCANSGKECLECYSFDKFKGVIVL